MKLDELTAAVVKLATEVAETFVVVNAALDELRSKLPDPADQAVVDNLTAAISVKAAELDGFQRQLAPPTP